MLPSIRPTPASDSPAAEQSSEEQLSKIFKDCSTSSCASLFRRLGAFLEFEATDIAVRGPCTHRELRRRRRPRTSWPDRSSRPPDSAGRDCETHNLSPLSIYRRLTRRCRSRNDPTTIICVSRDFSSKQACANALISRLFERKIPSLFLRPFAGSTCRVISTFAGWLNVDP